MSTYTDITVVPSDNLIIVNGLALRPKTPFAPIAGHEKLHALQWHGGQGALEFSDDMNQHISGDQLYAEEVQPYIDMWLAEKARLAAEQAKAEAEYNRIENVKARKLAELNRAMEEAKASSAVSILSSTG